MPTCNFTGRKFGPLSYKEILRTNLLAKVSAILFTNIKYVKQFCNWLKVRNDQHSAREMWSDHIKEGSLNKLDLTRERKPFPYIYFSPIDFHHKT